LIRLAYLEGPTVQPSLWGIDLNLLQCHRALAGLSVPFLRRNLVSVILLNKDGL